MRKALATTSILIVNISVWACISVFGPLIIDITESLSVSKSIIGTVHSLFLIISALFSIGWALLEKRYPRKMLLISAILLFSTSFFFTSLSSNLFTFFISRLISAIGFGAVIPLMNSIMIDLHPIEKRTKGFALLGTTTFLGFGAGIIITGVLLTMTTWRTILFILSINCLICLIIFSMMRMPKKMNLNDTQFFKIEKIKGLLHKHSNCFFILFFFIYDFVVGTVSFYMIPLIRTDFGYDPFTSMVIHLVIFAPQLIGAPYWGRKADRKFLKEPEGKVKTLFTTIVFGSLFSISAYSLHWFNVIFFILLLMVFTFITSSSTSIGYSILGDINTPKLRTTIFSLVNLSSIGGRSIGIALCGVLYDILKVNYSTIFLLWQLVFMMGLILSLIVPRKSVPSELLEKRILNIEIEETSQSTSLNDVVNMLLENQKKLAITLKNITEKQFYLTKFVYYSLELINRTLNRTNYSQNEKQNSIESIKVTI